MHAFNQGELKYYDLFHKDKDYQTEAMVLPLWGTTVLEIGSGTGLMTQQLRNLGYEVTTVDPNCPADFNDFKDAIGKQYDNVIALYDVLNYIPPYERLQLHRFRKTNFIYEVWDSNKPVRMFTYKKVENCHRVRLGIKIFGNAHLLFIYWGKGLALAYHKLYL